MEHPGDPRAPADHYETGPARGGSRGTPWGLRRPGGITEALRGPKRGAAWSSVVCSGYSPIEGSEPGLSLRGQNRGFATPTETKVHGDALCFVGKTRARHKPTKTGLHSGWRLVAVGSGLRLMVLGGCP